MVEVLYRCEKCGYVSRNKKEVEDEEDWPVRGKKLPVGLIYKTADKNLWGRSENACLVTGVRFISDKSVKRDGVLFCHYFSYSVNEFIQHLLFRGVSILGTGMLTLRKSRNIEDNLSSNMFPLSKQELEEILWSTENEGLQDLLKHFETVSDYKPENIELLKENLITEIPLSVRGLAYF